jgi:hypothetical protein
MFVEETFVPGGFGPGVVTESYAPAYGLGGFGAPICCPVGGCIPCIPCCIPSTCCYPGAVYY